MLVGDRPHNAAHGKTVEIVVNEDQHTQHGGGQQGPPAGLDPLAGPAAIGCRAAGLVHQCHQHTQQHKENQDAHIPAVADFGDHGVKGAGDHAPDIPVGAEQRTGQDAHKQGGVDLLGDQGQDNGDDGRQQGGSRRVAADVFPGGGDGSGDIAVKIGIGGHVVGVAVQILGSLIRGHSGGTDRHCHSAQEDADGQNQCQGSEQVLHIDFFLSFSKKKTAKGWKESNIRGRKGPTAPGSE